MSDTLERLAENYASALGHYLSGGGEAPLEQAYEFGRQAIEDRLGVLDLISIHQQALEAIALRALTPEENQRIAKQTMSFLTEALSPFEMTQRGYQETLARLHRLNETLEQEVAERTAALTAEVAEHRRAEEAVRQSEEHFRLIVDTALDAVITIDSQGAITGWNAQAEATFGWRAQDILGQTLTATIIPPRYREAHQHGLKHFLARGEGPVLNKRIEITALRRDGDEFPVELAITPVKSGESFIFSAFVRDITVRQRAEEQTRQSAARAQALAELSGALAAAHLDYQAVLDAVARRVVELIGDAGAIRLVSDDEQWLEVVSLYHPDAETLAFLREILTAIPQPVDEGLGGQVMKTHQPMLIPVVSSEQMRAMVPRTAWPVLERVNIHSLLVVPLRAQGRVLGTLALTRDRPGHSYTADDQSFLQDLADRAALAIANARLFVETQRLNTELEQRVTERTAQLAMANQELLYAKGEAEQARAVADRSNLAKSEFLSRMSHELRTPLNAILGFAQILEMENPTERQSGSIRQILQAGKHLLQLINEVLDISRIESGNLSMSPEPILVSEVVPETLDLVQSLATQRGIQLNMASLPHQHAHADRQRLKQVLLNLLTNAVKYNHPGGRVIVDCEVAPTQRLRIRVSDTGPGIPSDKMARLFVPFDRLGAESSDIEGSGIGLALSQRLVEVMGGVLGVESTVEQGSTFWVELPIVEGPLERVNRTGPLTVTVDPAIGKAQTVLYVEDNLSNLKLIEQILSYRPAIRLLSTRSGKASLDMARAQQPNLILLDLNLPDLPGPDVLRALQADSLTRDIPVVVVSADATPRQMERLQAAGARAYLTKPLEVQQFLKIIDEILKAVI